ncbi:MAG: ComF family protein [Spongiibacteraceae bacterium]|nr:ComF family protein [Spongiibacteraceae bacterium]
MVNRLSTAFFPPHKLSQAIESLAFIGNCIVCGHRSLRDIDICQACEDDLPWSQHQCQRCALPTPTDTKMCGQCILSPPTFHYALSVWVYAAPVAQLISAFKYQHCYSYGKVLAKIAAKTIASTHLHKPDLLIATPLHWWRHLRRGFNQSDYICNYWSQTLNIPIYRGIQRIKATPAQQSLHLQQRRRNISGAFRMKPSGTLNGQTVAIVDDVLTTGATANELSRCLLQAGASKVYLWCLARTPR